ncbi:MAG: hypothetical protein KA932_14175 [Giesbergeria sp.]|nr:hypothetical protein [Giesbergeria sp.]
MATAALVYQRTAGYQQARQGQPCRTARQVIAHRRAAAAPLRAVFAAQHQQRISAGY